MQKYIKNFKYSQIDSKLLIFLIVAKKIWGKIVFENWQNDGEKFFNQNTIDFGE
jgi:hypothetical protein